MREAVNWSAQESVGCSELALYASVDAGVGIGVDAVVDAGVGVGAGAGAGKGRRSNTDRRSVLLLAVVMRYRHCRCRCCRRRRNCGVGVDAGVDAGIGAGADASVDAGVSIGVDAVVDVGVGAGGGARTSQRSKTCRRSILPWCQAGQVGAATAGRVNVTTQASVLESYRPRGWDREVNKMSPPLSGGCRGGSVPKVLGVGVASVNNVVEVGSRGATRAQPSASGSAEYTPAAA